MQPDPARTGIQAATIPEKAPHREKVGRNDPAPAAVGVNAAGNEVNSATHIQEDEWIA